jgi:hypothetical protein
MPSLVRIKQVFSKTRNAYGVEVVWVAVRKMLSVFIGKIKFILQGLNANRYH